MKDFMKKNLGPLSFFVLGILCTVFSFLLCFCWSALQKPFVAVAVYAIDGCFLFANVFCVVDGFSKTRGRRILNTLLGGVLYLSLFSALGCCFFGDRITPELFGRVLQVAVFLAPVLVILLPVYFFIAYILGG